MQMLKNLIPNVNHIYILVAIPDMIHTHCLLTHVHANFQSKLDLEPSGKHICYPQFLGHLQISVLRMNTSFLIGEGQALNANP